MLVQCELINIIIEMSVRKFKKNIYKAQEIPHNDSIYDLLTKNLQRMQIKTQEPVEVEIRVGVENSKINLKIEYQEKQILQMQKRHIRRSHGGIILQNKFKGMGRHEIRRQIYRNDWQLNSMTNNKLKQIILRKDDRNGEYAIKMQPKSKFSINQLKLQKQKKREKCSMLIGGELMRHVQYIEKRKGIKQSDNMRQTDTQESYKDKQNNRLMCDENLIKSMYTDIDCGTLHQQSKIQNTAEENSAQHKISHIRKQFTKIFYAKTEGSAPNIKKHWPRSIFKTPVPYNASQFIIEKLKKMQNFGDLILCSFGHAMHRIDINTMEVYARKKIHLSYYIGGGNNRQLLVMLMKRRWWWKIQTNPKDAKFVWSQTKMKSLESSSFSNGCESSIESKSKNPKIVLLKSNNFWQSCKTNHLPNVISKICLPNFIPSIDLNLISSPSLFHNHYKHNYLLGNKRSLLKLLTLYLGVYLANPNLLKEIIPETYLIRSRDEQVLKFISGRKNYWIVKPGQNSNRGRGIFVTDKIQKIEERLSQHGTLIVQRYILDLLLYNGRKFDIRAYLLAIKIGSVNKFYFYSQGYLRTSSQIWSIEDLENQIIHLTNDAVQNRGGRYGKFQKGNKLSYADLEKYLQPNGTRKIQTIIKKMKEIATIVAKSVQPIFQKQESACTFQLFGLDFLIDRSLNPLLLQVNTNPCLELSAPLLERIIPRMVQNILRLTVDVIYPPYILPSKEGQYYMNNAIGESNRFQIIDDGAYDEKWRQFILKELKEDLDEEEEKAIQNSQEQQIVKQQ